MPPLNFSRIFPFCSYMAAWVNRFIPLDGILDTPRVHTCVGVSERACLQHKVFATKGYAIALFTQIYCII